MADNFDEFISDKKSPEEFDQDNQEYSYDVIGDGEKSSYNPDSTPAFLNDKNIDNNNLKDSLESNDIIGPTIDKPDDNEPFKVSTNFDNQNNNQQGSDLIFDNNSEEQDASQNHLDLVSQKSDISQNNTFRKKSKLFYAIIGVMLLIFVSAGTIFATEMGIKTGFDKVYNLVGLEKLWGGLPSDGKIALIEAIVNMSKVKSSHFESNMAVEASFDSQGISSLQTFLNSKAKFALESSNEGRVLGTDTEIDSNNNAIIRLNIKASGDYQKDKMQAKITVGTPLLNDGLSYYNLKTLDKDTLELYIRQIGDKLYLKIPLISKDNNATEAKWLEFKRSDADSYIKMYADTSNSEKQNSLLDYYALISSSQKIGTEEINGHQTAKYKSKIDADKLVALLIGNNQADSEILKYKPEIILYYWIGKDDYYIHKFAVSINSNEQGAKIKTNFETTLSKFDKTFNVQVPETKDIEKGGVSTLFGD